jgi:hypothetical protein
MEMENFQSVQDNFKFSIFNFQCVLRELGH